MRIAIIGAGMAGLSCATALTARGHEVVFGRFLVFGELFKELFARDKWQFHIFVAVQVSALNANFRIGTYS